MAPPGQTARPGRRRLPARSRELVLRVVSGVVLGLVVLGTLVVGGWAFALVWLVAGAVGAAEWIGMSRTEPRLPLAGVVALTLAGLLLCRLAGAGPIPALAVLGLGALLCLALAQGGPGRLRALGALLGGAVIALVPPSLRETPAIGILGPAWMFAVVWSTDIAAYFTGRALGGPKLAPAISPGKTWSGALGGLIGAVAAGTLTVALFDRYGWSPGARSPLALVAFASAAASVLSQGGDLLESALKRRYGVKDSGRTIPGHGGVMDRLDGFFPVALLAGLFLVLHRLPA